MTKCVSLQVLHDKIKKKVKKYLNETEEKREVGPSKGNWGIAAIAKACRRSFSTEDVK